MSNNVTISIQICNLIGSLKLDFCAVQQMRFRFFIFLFFFQSGLICSQDYYVSVNLGSDSNNGTEIAPFKTINRAISSVNAGGTIYVMEGVYRNNNYGTVDLPSYSNMNNPHVVTINKSGSDGNYITLRNFPGELPKIQFDGSGGILIANNMNYIIVEGFEVEGPAQAINYDMAIANRQYKISVAEDGNDNTNYNHTYFSGKGIWGGYGAHHHIIIRNNIVHDTPGSAIRFNDSDHITIEHNEVYNSTWWTSSASSAVVFAETIAASESDNGNDVKMIMRGNTVYNNWNRIPFYVTQLPDNSGNTNPNYGTASYNSILDGQGLYVTRSDPDYNGTFLIENNLCVNNGKNGINFDNSLGASAIIQNNTIFFNGVHEIIQDISEANGNPAHRGQKVGGIKSNKVLNSTVVNNIVVTRDNLFSALELPNVYGSRLVSNNIFLNGKLPSDENGNPYNYISCCSMIDIDPLFVNAPLTVNGPIDIDQTNFQLTENSPAIDAGDSNYSPQYDILGNPRPELNEGISSSSFENSVGGWSSFGASIQTSQIDSRSGDQSLLISDRTLNWHSAKLVLDNLLTQGDSYTFYVWVKLALGVSGSSQITIKNTSLNTYTNITPTTEVSDQEWTLLSGDYTYSDPDNMFVYVKGPSMDEGGGNYYIDDFSLVPQGSQQVDFSNAGDVVDIGAYEYNNNSMSIESNSGDFTSVSLYPNPAKSFINISQSDSNYHIEIIDPLGKRYILPKRRVGQAYQIDISKLKNGLYLIKLVDTTNFRFKVLRFLKN